MEYLFLLLLIFAIIISCNLWLEASSEDSGYIKYVFLVVMIFVIAISYNLWLNAGCKTMGYMTWEGRACVEELNNQY